MSLNNKELRALLKLKDSPNSRIVLKINSSSDDKYLYDNVSIKELKSFINESKIEPVIIEDDIMKCDNYLFNKHTLTCDRLDFSMLYVNIILSDLINFDENKKKMLAQLVEARKSINAYRANNYKSSISDEASKKANSQPNLSQQDLDIISNALKHNIISLCEDQLFYSKLTNKSYQIATEVVKLMGQHSITVERILSCDSFDVSPVSDEILSSINNKLAKKFGSKIYLQKE